MYNQNDIIDLTLDNDDHTILIEESHDQMSRNSTGSSTKEVVISDKQVNVIDLCNTDDEEIKTVSDSYKTVLDIYNKATLKEKLYGQDSHQASLSRNVQNTANLDSIVGYQSSSVNGTFGPKISYGLVPFGQRGKLNRDMNKSSKQKNSTGIQLTFFDQAKLVNDREGFLKELKEREEQKYSMAIRPQEDMENIYKSLLTGINEKVNLELTREETPTYLNIKLLEHQRVGLTWMLKMENSDLKGGLLSDEMGLGKTIQSLATIVKQKESPIIPCRTLIVAPLALIYQWQQEILEKTKKGLLRVVVYHGTQKIKSPEILKGYDVVLTTYSTLANQYKPFKEDQDKDIPIYYNKKQYPLYTIKWNRVILDEAHTIKNRNTGGSKACCALRAKYRWCLSGTPIQNSLDDLYPILKFLRVKPYTDWFSFNKDFNLNPKKKHSTENFVKIRTILEGNSLYSFAIKLVISLKLAISLRRCKDSMIDGKAILNLPEKVQETVEVLFSPEEKKYYESVEKKTQSKYNSLLKRRVRPSMIGILVLLLRLRQVCTHPKLTIGDYEKNLEEEAMLNEIDTDLDEFNKTGIYFPAAKKAIKKCHICKEKSDDYETNEECEHKVCKACLNNYRMVLNRTACSKCHHKSKVLNDKKTGIITKDISLNGLSLDDKSDLDLNMDDGEEMSEEDKKMNLALFESSTSAKINKCVEILHQIKAKDGNKKTIVFTQFITVFKIMMPFLLENGFTCFTYDGSMNISQREKCIDQFNKYPSGCILLMSLRCGSVGLNLTSANCVIFMDLWWNPAIENQAMDRVHRIGQRSGVEVYKLVVPGTVEDRILALQETKQSLFDGAFGKDGMGQSKSSRLTLNDLKFLLGVGTKPTISTNNNTNNTLNENDMNIPGHKIYSSNPDIPSPNFMASARVVTNHNSPYQTTSDNMSETWPRTNSDSVIRFNSNVMSGTASNNIFQTNSNPIVGPKDMTNPNSLYQTSSTTSGNHFIQGTQQYPTMANSLNHDANGIESLDTLGQLKRAYSNTEMNESIEKAQPKMAKASQVTVIELD
ncbi:hypothetical protein K502DRAFT_363891 [Neoconidiobolus thromboides FSU 785]|nr:hypothetical protein K502DRAFT_363891 [Neoconidiobolus thromboides FSU 785]